MQLNYPIQNVKLSLTLSLLFAFITFKGTAQYADTLSRPLPVNNFWNSPLVKKTTIPATLLIATAVTWPHKQEIREVRNRFIPKFRYHFDDYLQYAPGVAVATLNAFNVKGKHSPKRAFASSAFSMMIMGTLVNTIKHTASVERPDGSSKNTFPSGHTAMAFTNATILDKEYGQYRHQLYGVGGYAMATATALGRGLNNRHWVPDVLTGAAIGILSTELGYMIADKIFGDKGINAPLRNNPIPISNKPSFIELHLGYANALSKDLTTVGTDEFKAKQGFNFGLEGAWFMSKYVGIGGELAFTSFPVNSDRIKLDDELLDLSTGIHTQALGVKYLNIGPYFSYPLPNNWFITAKVNTGISSGSSGNIILELNEKTQKELGRSELRYLRYKPKTAESWSAGMGIQKRIGRNTAIKAYTTYFSSKHEFAMQGLDDIKDNGELVYTPIQSDNSKVNFNHLTFGLGLTAFLW